MPRRSLSPCTTPGCPELTTGGPCPTCHAQRRQASDARRPNAAARGYGPAWRKTRARYLKRHPTCQWPGCTHPATDVDHIDGSGPHGDNRDTNLQALCHPHHSHKTATHNGGYGNPTPHPPPPT